jgi:hypothetical protein
VFQYLLEQAVDGNVPVFGVVMRPDNLRRYAEYFHPEVTDEGRHIVDSIMAAWNSGASSQPWVYPRGRHYVISDDYFTLAAIERGRPEAIGAQVLGWATGPDILQKTGPLSATHVRRLLGWQEQPKN